MGSSSIALVLTQAVQLDGPEHIRQAADLSQQPFVCCFTFPKVIT
jgi:hypothetical protein